MKNNGTTTVIQNMIVPDVFTVRDFTVLAQNVSGSILIMYSY